MADVGFIEVRIKGDKSGLDDLEQSAKTSAKKIQAAFTGLGAKIGATLTVGVAVTGIKEAIKSASDLQETTGKFNVVFRGVEESARKMSQELVDGYAMSTQEAMSFMSAMQDMLKPMGMATDKAAEMSADIVKLSADLGSFNNLPTAQVMEDIQSAMVGNYETVRKYGTMISAAAVEQNILNKGLAATKDAITPLMKAQEVYAMIVANNADAVGDMARTQDSLANRSKALSARIEDMKARFGDAVISSGALDKALDTLNPAVNELTTYIADHKDEIGEMAVGMANFAINAGKAAIEIAKLLAPLGELSKWAASNPGWTGLIAGGAIGARVGGAPGAIIGGVIGSGAGAAKAFSDYYSPKSALGGGGVTYSWEESTAPSKTPPATSPSKTPPAISPGSPGGGSSVKSGPSLSDRMDDLRQSLATEAQLEAQSYVERLKLISDFYAGREDLTTEDDELRAKVAADFEEKMAEINGLPAMQRNLEEMQTHFKTQEELEMDDYQAKLDRLAEFRDNEITTEQDYADLKQKIEAEHQENMNRIVQEGLSAREKFNRMSIIQQADTIFGELANITAGVAQHNKTLFQINKAAGIANAVINTYEGVSETLSKYPWPIAGVMAAAHLAAGLAQVSAISSAQFEGGGSGSAASVAGSTAATPVSDVGQSAAISRTITVYGIDRNSLYSGDQIEAIVSGLNDYLADGGVINIA